MANIRVYTTKGGAKRYMARVWHNGTQYGAAGTTEAKAEKAAWAKAHAAKASTPSDHTATLGTYYENWLAAMEPDWSESNKKCHREHYEKHIKGPLGGYPLTALDLNVLQPWVDDLATPDQKHRCRNMLKQCLKTAVHRRLLPFNPCEGLRLPKIVHREQQAWDEREICRFLALPMAPHYQAYFWLRLAFPTRPGEVLGLRWSAIDLETGQIDLRESRSTYGTTTKPGRLKTPESYRNAKTGEQALEVLRRWKTAQDALRERLGRSWKGEDYVCTNEKGRPMRHGTVRARFKEMAAEAGLPNIALYELRHSVITAMIDSGEAVEKVAKLAGHADVNITLNVYRRVRKEQRHGASLAWSKRIAEGTTGLFPADS